MIEKISIKYYLISVFLPITFIILMFGFATKYINDEIIFTKHEILGLKKVNEIHSIVIHLQRLRGIISMPHTSQKYALEKKQYIYETKKKIKKLRKFLEPNDKNHLAHKTIYNYLSSILQLFEAQHNFTKNEVFLNYSKINEKSFEIHKDIALHSNLILDSNKKSFLLMDTIIIQLPRLIEFNGQLRALLTAQGNKVITKKEFADLSTRMSKINDLSQALNYNMTKIFKLNNIHNNNLNNQYKNTMSSKDKLLNFINANFKENIMLSDSETIYEFFTENINSMIALYNLNSKVLKNVLKQRRNHKTNIINLIIGFGVLSVLFIFYNFFNYYRKNNDLIATINNSNIILKEQSITDGMTLLFNRRYFDIIFEQQLNQSKRIKTSLIVMICDIDNFKKYNDTYGHILGDEALIKVAQSLKSSLKRPNDYAFRIGGEEFGIILSDMTVDKAKGFAKTIKYNIERLNVEHENNDGRGHITISMGIAYVNQNNNIFSISQIYDSADEALYKSKNSGRNQININEV